MTTRSGEDGAIGGERFMRLTKWICQRPRLFQCENADPQRGSAQSLTKSWGGPSKALAECFTVSWFHAAGGAIRYHGAAIQSGEGAIETDGGTIETDGTSIETD